jgi:16S rRNA (adenine1518-N6/adenine1519-N6)-dimethyltransferase
MPLSPSATRALLDQLGHHPRRALGQNFLVDGNIVRKSLELAAIAPADRVVEIGPGLGTLTAALLEAGAEVWAVERDATLTAHLRTSLAPRFPATLHLLEADAMDEPLAGLRPDPTAGFKVVANLPYAICSPWMDALLAGPLPSRMVLMLQREAADRYTTRHGSKNFGAISILLQSAYLVAPGHPVAAACFHPRPDVDSVLVHLVLRPDPVVFSPAARSLVRSIFTQRRKQIAALLRERLPDGGRGWLEHLGAAGLDGRTRPEEIPVPLWQRLLQGLT